MRPPPRPDELPRHGRASSGPREPTSPSSWTPCTQSRAGPSLVVTPTEREAESIVQDLDSLRRRGRRCCSPGGEPRRTRRRAPWPRFSATGCRSSPRLLAGEPLTGGGAAARVPDPRPGPAYLAAQIFTVRSAASSWTRRQTADRLAARGIPAGAQRQRARGVRRPREKSSTCSCPARSRRSGSPWTSTRSRPSGPSIPSTRAPPGSVDSAGDHARAGRSIFAEEMRGPLAAALESQGFAAKEAADEDLRARSTTPRRAARELFFPLVLPRAVLPAGLPRRRTPPCSSSTATGWNPTPRRCARSTWSCSAGRGPGSSVVPGPQKILLDFAGAARAQCAPQRGLPDAALIAGAAGAPGSRGQGPSGGARLSPFPATTRARSSATSPSSARRWRSSLKNGYKVFIFAVYDVQADRLRHILKDLAVTILPQSISGGLRPARSAKIMAIQEAEIFGRKRRIPRSVGTARSAAIESFVELEPGRLRGARELRHRRVPRHRAHLGGGQRARLHHARVRGRGEALPPHRAGQPHPALHRPGGQAAEAGHPRAARGGRSGRSGRRRRSRTWPRALLDLYSRRKAEPGFAFPPDTDWQSEFEAAFPYQETEDQLRCIEDVKRDMEAPIAMDRLVCGDVGYGKTEIALRAAFKAVMSGRQVALLAPDDDPRGAALRDVHGALRALPREDRHAVALPLAQGAEDGHRRDRRRGRGHRHRHAPADPEGREVPQPRPARRGRGAALRREAQGAPQADEDVRGLPHAHRHAHPAHAQHVPHEDPRHVHPEHRRRRTGCPSRPSSWSSTRRWWRAPSGEEIERGGQVYYLHNRVETIQEIHSFLQRLVPEVSMAVGHGQMDEDELEEVMRQLRARGARRCSSPRRSSRTAWTSPT